MARRLSAFFSSSDDASQPGIKEPQGTTQLPNKKSAKALSKLDTSSPSQKPLPHSRSASHLPSLGNFVTPTHGNTLAPPQRAMGELGLSPSTMAPDSAEIPRPSSAPGHKPPPVPPEPPNSANPKLRKKSWGRKGKDEGPRAWIAGHNTMIPYDLNPLVNARRVPELWDESGDTLVYLFPRTSDKGPSFRIRSSAFSSSVRLTKLAHGKMHGQKPQKHETNKRPEKQHRKPVPWRHDAPATPPLSPKINPMEHSSPSSSRGTRTTDDSLDDNVREIELYLPIGLTSDTTPVSPSSKHETSDEGDIETLIAARNLFAFLLGQSLVGTPRRPSIFSIFMNISEFLKSYEFTNLDGSTFGEVAATSFDIYVQELSLADVRTSREQTIEALVLGERMRSVVLYNEAFTHAAGKYDDLQEIMKFPAASAKWNMISPVTHKRLERAHLDLVKRQEKVNYRLTDFEFPSIFAGVLNSRTVDERKDITFSAWKEAFLATRRHVLAYYKQKYGQWPPKASSKKNSLSRSGLNRIVLRRLYFDMADIYNLFVDRTSLTTRSDVSHPDDVDHDSDSPERRIIRRVFDEYDRSMPPVQPPVPYDTPILPNLSSLHRDNRSSAPPSPSPNQDPRSRTKRLSDEELGRVLNASCNHDSLSESGKNPFVVSLLNMEHKAARSATVSQLVDTRVGLWLFVYAVLQTLPMLVVDAPAVRHHQAVEYFLCEPPLSGVPWASGEAAQRSKQTWYGVAGGQGMVSLPSDLVENGVEGVYRRSHCWIMAAKWSAAASAGMAPTGVVASPGQVERELRQHVDQQLLAPPGGPQPHHGISLPPSSSQHSSSHLGSWSLPPPPTISEPFGGGGGIVVSRPGSAAGGGGSGQASRTSSPHRGRAEGGASSNRESIVNIGLEALPLPAGVSPGSRDSSRPGSRASGTREASQGTMTFDQIIAGMEKSGGGKRAKKMSVGK